jgi:hypothetical protein
VSARKSLLSLNSSITVKMFTNDTFCCPVDAYKKWRRVSNVSHCRTQPAFRMEDGACYTGTTFNDDLKDLLGRFINYDKRKILSHSFRAGNIDGQTCSSVIGICCKLCLWIKY